MYLLQQLSQDNVGFREVADVIRTDAPLGTDLLRLANSALSGRRFPVTGIRHALAMLGLDRVRSLITTVALRKLIGPAGGTPALQRCWRHNLACAFLAEEAARNTDLDRDFAYTAGLLHDIGRLSMMSAWRAPYAALLDSAKPEDLLSLERQQFGIPHTRAGFALAQNWKLPAIFGEIADHHHDPPPEGVIDAIAVVHFGCQFADTLGFGVSGQPAAEREPGQPSPLRPLIAGSLEDAASRVAERIKEFESCVGG
jgi:putative nucleotidyltransferase with HDIG domain